MVNISKIIDDKVTVIIDGNSVAYRAFFKAPPLSVDGMPTGVIHLFLQVLSKLKSNEKVSKLIAVFDAKGKNKRHELLEQYKATRLSMPEDLAVQMDALKKVIPLMDIPLYCVDGYEADDVIFTLCSEVEGNIWIVTKDKDLYQLIDDRVQIYDYQTDLIVDREKTFEKFLLYPENIADMLSLAGDTSDNIPGVAGVGIKTATTLIEKYKTLDNIYVNIAEIKGKLQEKLIDQKEMAYLSRELVTLQSISNLRPFAHKPDPQAFRAFLEQYRLKYHLLKLDDEVAEPIEESFVALSYGHVDKAELIVSLGGNVYVIGGSNYFEYSDESAPLVYDVKSLIKKGVKLDDNVIDIMLASWLLDADTGGLKQSKLENELDFLARLYSKSNEVVAKLKEASLEKLYFDMELPIAKILAEMEQAGILIDADIIKKVSKRLKEEVAKLSTRISNVAQRDININSPKQLSSYLFEVLGMTPPKKNKTGFSTDEEVLLDLRANYPENADILDDILLYRELNKLLSTYTDSLLSFQREDRRIHSEFKQTGTATGRLSSTNPNLQNIPQGAGVASELRSAFLAKKGYSLVSFDYSQIELRILAEVSKDENLIKAFKDSADIHNITAKSIFSLNNDDEITIELRRIAKAVNFGILYGLSPFGLARDAKVTASKGKEFIDSYFATYPKVKTFISDTIASSKEFGYTETLLGRKRIIADINSRNANIRQRAERMAVNAPIQGSASDIIKLAMIAADKHIKDRELDAKLILQVHDELIFECNDEILEKFELDINEIMENVIKLNVPLIVNSCHGKHWSDL